VSKLPANLFHRLVVMMSPDPAPAIEERCGALFDLVEHNPETQVAVYGLRDAPSQPKEQT
jgi:hypothetical protein